MSKLREDEDLTCVPWGLWPKQLRESEVPNNTVSEDDGRKNYVKMRFRSASDFEDNCRKQTGPGPERMITVSESGDRPKNFCENEV